MKLDVRDLACERGGHPVFADVSFALEPGDLLVLQGANGAGKSSLLRLLSGLGRPAAGTIRADGEPVADEPAAFTARAVYVGHQDALKPAFTVAENLAFWTRLQRGGDGAEADIDAALVALGLAALRDLPARLLSAGQRRRAALARAVAADAELWLLDEPTNALDTQSLAAFEAALGRHLDAGGSAIVSSHVAVGGGRGTVLHLGGEDAS